MIVKEGLALEIGVKGFGDARLQLNTLIRARIVKCALCSKPATHVYWQDQAEWYEHCEDHRSYDEQWTGSTRWGSPVLSVAVIPDAARTWLAGLPEAERALYTLDAYDNRNLYDLMPEWGTRDPEVHTFTANEAQPDWHTKVEIQRLTTGEFAYEIHTQQGNYGRYYGLVGTFDTRDEALTHALTENEDMPRQFRTAPADDPEKTKPIVAVDDETIHGAPLN